MDQELQQAVRIQRCPDKRQRQLQNLAGGAKRRIMLEPHPWQADASQRVVQNDAVLIGDDNRSFGVLFGAEQFGDGLCREVSGPSPNDDQRTVLLQLRGLVAGQQRLQLAEVRVRKGRRPGLCDWFGLQALGKLTPGQRQIVRVIEQRQRFDLRTTRRQKIENAPKPLPQTRRQALASQRLDGCHVHQSRRDRALERAIPTVQVPVLPPIEQQPRDADRIDIEGGVVEATEVVALRQTFAVERNLLRWMQRWVRKAQIALDQAQKPPRSHRDFANSRSRRHRIETVARPAKTYTHGRACYSECSILRAWGERKVVPPHRARPALATFPFCKGATA